MLAKGLNHMLSGMKFSNAIKDMEHAVKLEKIIDKFKI